MHKKVLAVAIASAMAAPGAYAVEASVSGHVNRAILFADDGFDSDVMHVDNINSQSRFRIRGSEDLGIGGMKVGVLLEAGWSSNANSRVTIKGRNGNVGGNDISFNIRHNMLWFSGAWGRLNLGHTSQAYDGVADNSLSGSTFLGGQTNGSTTGSSIRFKRTGNATVNNGSLTNRTVGGAYQNFDGGRQDVLRYDTPNLGPLSARISVGDNQDWSVRGHLNTSFSGARIDIKGGYADRENDAKDSGGNGQITELWGIGASILFSQGTNFTVAYSGGDVGTRTAGLALLDQGEGETIYLKLGHRWGNNAIAIDYGNSDLDASNNAGFADEDTTRWGIGMVHTLPGPGVELYAGYTNYDLDVQNVNGIEDVDLFSMGARVRF